MVRILVYTHAADMRSNIFRRNINALQGAEVSFFQDGAHLVQEMKKEWLPRPIIVFKAFDREDLLFLHSVRDIVAYARLILILPDSDAETISMGHSLYPRFLTFADGDLNDVLAVVDKMIGNELRSSNIKQEQAYSGTVVY